jgi:rare lipoprotein A
MGPPYHNRQGANGKVFDENAMTAAHRTLPMGSLIVVTNEKTGQSATMRVTDRGPFVPGRVLDLSMASAKATGVYRAGLASVRIDVYETPRIHGRRRPLVRADRRLRARRQSAPNCAASWNADTRPRK